MVLLCCAAGGAAATDFSGDGPFVTALSEISVPRAEGGSFRALLAFPALAGTASRGARARPDATAGPYPALVFGHGFLSPPMLYTITLRRLASWGMVVLAPASALELFPSHPDYAADYSHAVDWLQGTSDDAASTWAGMVDPDALAAGGHSMGGGAAVLAAAADPRLKALVLLAPSQTWPERATDAAEEVDVPALVVAGSDDAITPLALHALPIYARLAGDRQLALMFGGSHCGFVPVPLPEILCDAAGISLEEQLAAVSRSLVPFLLHTLAGRADLAAEVWGRDRIWQPPTFTVLRRTSR
jgi:dienelactone hydrolase